MRLKVNKAMFGVHRNGLFEVNYVIKGQFSKGIVGK